MTIEKISEMEDYLSALRAEHDSAIVFGDFKVAYKLADKIEMLERRKIILRLGQSSFNEARTLFPNAIVRNQTYSRSLEIDGDDYRPNLHDSGHVTGWHIC